MSMVDNVKDAVKLVQQLDNIDLLKKMMEIQTDAFNLSTENIALGQKVKQLARKSHRPY